MHIFYPIVLALATTPISKNLEISAPLSKTVSAIIVSEDDIAKAFRAEILEHKIESMRPRWIIGGDNPRVSWLVKGKMKFKAKLPISKEPVIIEFNESIEVGKRFIYLLEAKESDLINRLDTRIELWEEDGITRGKAELWIDLKIKNRWTSLFGRIMLTRLNRIINELVNPPEPEVEEKPIADTNQIEARDRQDTPQLSVGSFLPELH